MWIQISERRAWQSRYSRLLLSTLIQWSTLHSVLCTMKECSSKEVLIVKKSWNDPLWLSSQPNLPGGQQDQGHGLVLHDHREGYQQPITFRSGSKKVSMSVEEVSLYFLGGDSIQYIRLVPIYPRSSCFLNPPALHYDWQRIWIDIRRETLIDVLWC